MRKLIYCMHVTLDGFVAGTAGEMDWIYVDNEIFDLVSPLTDAADTALYGRVTYQMMDAYWPTAGDEPGASRHDREHSAWYNRVNKIVLSKSLAGQDHQRTQIISEEAVKTITAIKQQEGKNILVFGSPSTMHGLMPYDLIDEYWLFINPVLLGEGIPLFKNIREKGKLALLTSKIFGSGIVCLHYERIK